MAITRRAVLKGFAGATAAVVTSGGAYGFFDERHQLVVNHSDVHVAGLPVALTGLRIGFITDLHCSRWFSPDDVHGVAARLNEEKPDIIFLGGDYVTWGDRQFVHPSADGLAGLSAPHGVFGILGNHDDDRDMPAALNSRRIAVLRDARTRLTVNGEIVNLVGIRFWTKRPSDIAALVRAQPGMTILLAHDPRRLSEAAALNVPLVLSGHTHGGQVVLPLVGPIAARKFPVVSGIGGRDKTTMFVSRGVGTVYVPVRINCPPEVAVLTLRSG